MDNLPPGVTDKDIDNQFPDEQLIEQAEENLEVLYRLILQTKDGEVLYEEGFFSQESLQSTGLRKAEIAYEEAVNKEVEFIKWQHKGE